VGKRYANPRKQPPLQNRRILALLILIDEKNVLRKNSCLQKTSTAQIEFAARRQENVKNLVHRLLA
jgi:hypothetical protein